MSLQPIDLQTLFMRMAQVSRDQAAFRDSEIHNQDAVGREIQQKTAHRSHSVNETEEIQDGPEKLHDDDESSENQPQHSSHRDQEQESGEQNDQLQDPNLGKNIDFSG